MDLIYNKHIVLYVFSCLNIQRFSNFTTDNTKAETDKEARNLKTKVIWLVLFTKYCYFISSVGI